MTPQEWTAVSTVTAGITGFAVAWGTLQARVKALNLMITSQFETLNRRLDVLDRRCEERGKLCPDHFLILEKKIAVLTGKANGE